MFVRDLLETFPKVLFLCRRVRVLSNEHLSIAKSLKYDYLTGGSVVSGSVGN